ncbi:MAG: redoxin family protein [Phycisphaerales bacterium]|jgi:thiol-disulfide isomerase/thioredoxin
MKIATRVLMGVVLMCAGWQAASERCGHTGLAMAQPGESSKPFPDEWFFSGAQRPQTLKALEGKPAPTLSIGKWIGDATTIEANRGKVVVVDFWATWCGPCMRSLPHNVELVKQYSDKGLVFIGVHDSENGWENAPAVVRSKNINYPVGQDSGGASVKAFGLQFWPTYVAIDRSGKVRAAGLLPDRVEDVVKVLLAEAGGPVASAAASEFGPEFYYGGIHRPGGLKDMEGKPAPELKGATWLGEAPSQAGLKGSVSVVTFVSPVFDVSMGELDKIAPVRKEFAAQGVAFLGVADGRCNDTSWAKLAERMKTKKVDEPILRDEVSGKTDPKTSVTASAYGVTHFPATFVVDRAGVVRAAGVRADKVKPIVEKLLAEGAAKEAPKPAAE